MIKTKKIGLALAAALSIGAAAQTTQAANLAPDGVGEMVYAPYYSTKDGRQTFIRLVNTSFNTIAVKVKIREGTNSEDVRDFHLFLSPRDAWTGKIYADKNGEPRLYTEDTSCTAPDKTRGWTAEGNGWSVGISNPTVPGTDSTEGYVLAVVMGTSETSKFNPFTVNESVASLVKHVNGVPRNCFAVSSAFDLTTDGQLTLKNPDRFDSVRSQFTEPTNVLAGFTAIANPVAATLTDLPTTTVANVWNARPDGLDGPSGYNEPHNDIINDTIQTVTADTPDETVSKSVAGIYSDIAGKSGTLTTVSTGNVNPVSAALMKSSVLNSIDTTGNFSWVVTFPTRIVHSQNPEGTLCTDPFPANCKIEITSILHTVHDNGSGFSYITNEEESEFSTPDSDQICFSGTDLAESCPTGSDAQIFLPNEVNVVTFGGGNPLNSALTTNITRDFLGKIALGWMQMRFNNAQSLVTEDSTTGDEVTLYGLPVIGSAYSEFIIDGITSTMNQPHKFTSPLTK